MPLNQRVSGSHERKPSTGSGGSKSSSTRNHVRFSDVEDDVASSLGSDEDLRDALQRAHTEWNKATQARDRLQTLFDQTNKKLSESNKAKDDLKLENQVVKDLNTSLKQELQRLKDLYAALKFEQSAMVQSNNELKTRYDNLLLRLDAAQQPQATSPLTTTSLPERSTESRSSPKEKHRDDRGRTRDKERAREKEKEKEKEREREKAREKEREREERREKEKEKREREKEKEKEHKRLSQRFESKRPPPPGHRDSFIEPWGPGGRSTSVNPNTRAYTNVATGRMQPPALTQSHQPAYSAIPRVSGPLSPTIYDNSALVFDDDDDEDGRNNNSYEDGNYHAHPLAR